MGFWAEGGALLIWCIVLGIFLFMLFASIQSVSQGEQRIVELFGRYNRTLRPGLNFVIPFVESVRATVDIREKYLSVPPQNVITKDNATVTVDGVLFYTIRAAAASVYNVTNLDKALETLKLTNLRAVIGAMDLDEVLSHRDQINARLCEIIGTAAEPWGVNIMRVELQNVKPLDDMQKVMERQMTAERDKRAAVLKAEGEKQAAFMRAEAREREAQAEAMATQLVNEAAANNPTALNYFIAEKYLGALSQLATSPNEKILIMPMELTSVLGSLAGMAEIARQTFAPKPDQRVNGADASPRPPLTTPRTLAPIVGGTT